MSSEIVISAKGLGKTYRVYDHPLHRLLSQLSFFGNGRRCREFHALRDISFDVRRGEAVGIIGRNGSGKSTLLQLICGIRKPTVGTIRVNGRVSALLELGAGFHPEFTGRENVFLQGAIQGLSRQEMESRFDDITAFADIGEFIDQPVRTYSSGMFVRLAFAVAIHVDPEILVIDEALSVGDYAFQSKCVTFLQQFRERGGTMIFVSHDINIIKALCDTGICLKKEGGCLVGPVDTVSQAYLRNMRSEMQGNDTAAELTMLAPAFGKDGPSQVNGHLAPEVEASRQGTGEARITTVELLDEEGHPLVQAWFGQRVTVRLHIQFHASCEVLAAYYIRDDKNRLLGSSTLLEGAGLLPGAAGDRKIVEFSTELPLIEGSYSVQVQLSAPVIPNVSAQLVDYLDNAVFFSMEQRWPTKIWSKTYVKNTVTVRE